MVGRWEGKERWKREEEVREEREMMREIGGERKEMTAGEERQG